MAGTPTESLEAEKLGPDEDTIIHTADSESSGIKRNDGDDTDHKASLIPDFESLAATENAFSEGASPPPVYGDDARSTPRGRPALTPEERDARRKARAESGGKTRKKKIVAGSPPSVESAATAEMVVGSLDMVLSVVSNGEFAAVDKVRKAYVSAWSKYIHVTGKELPAWAEVSIMSAVYIAPAFRSPTAVERVKYAFFRIKNFFTEGFKKS